MSSGSHESDSTTEVRLDTLVIGAGQAGLAAGYYLGRQGRDFLILDSAERIGDSWRNRWGSLRLFTPASLSALPGMPHEYPGNYFLTKDEIAGYLERYVGEFALPVRLRQRVRSLSRVGSRYVVDTRDRRYFAENVVVATGAYHSPRVPEFARSLDGGIHQVHSSEYRGPEQLPEGDVLVVGAGNSGSEISLELSRNRRVFLSGRDTGNVPGGVRGDFMPRRTLVAWRTVWWLLSRFTPETRFGRSGREFSRSRGVPLVRFSPADLSEAGVERVPRVRGVADGKPELEDGSMLDVENILWATGFRPDFGWIKLSICDETGYPVQSRGAVDEAPGLYFLGLPFLHTFFSETIGGAGEDAKLVADHLDRARS